MPFVYGVIPGATTTTNAAANTPNDAFFIKPGASKRGCAVQAFRVQGRGSSVPLPSGIGFRLEMWTTTASSGGTGITPSPRDMDAPVANATAGFSATTVTSGTGGPSLKGGFGCSTTGPGQWISSNPDTDVMMDSAANVSLDIFNVAATASLVYEIMDCEIRE